MGKSPDAFRTISEVAETLGTQPHVLRFWESKFSQVKPVKRAGGRRYYRPADIHLLAGIKHLLHDEGMTIKGVQKVLREKGIKHVAGFSADLEGDADVLAELAGADVPDMAEVIDLVAGRPQQDPSEVAERGATAPDDDTVLAEAPPEPGQAELVAALHPHGTAATGAGSDATADADTPEQDELAASHKPEEPAPTPNDPVAADSDDADLQIAQAVAEAAERVSEETRHTATLEPSEPALPPDATPVTPQEPPVEAGSARDPATGIGEPPAHAETEADAASSGAAEPDAEATDASAGGHPLDVTRPLHDTDVALEDVVSARHRYFADVKGRRMSQSRELDSIISRLRGQVQAMQQAGTR